MLKIYSRKKNFIVGPKFRFGSRFVFVAHPIYYVPLMDTRILMVTGSNLAANMPATVGKLAEQQFVIHSLEVTPTTVINHGKYN